MAQRIIPELMTLNRDVLDQHLVRYKFARRFCKGKVLDIVCGVGYGTEILLKQNPKIEKLVGIDTFEDVVEYAKNNYQFLESEYYVDSITDKNLVEKYGTFHTIVSFKTLEYIDDPHEFIDNLFDLLEEEGLFIVSAPLQRNYPSPDSTNFSSGSTFTKENFLNLIQNFSKTTLYGQYGPMIEPYNNTKKYDYIISLCEK